MGEVGSSEELAADVTKGSGGASREGFVLGIDVGFSRTRKATGLCLLSWRENQISWRCQNTGSDEKERENALRSLVPPRTQLNAVAIDGPLTHGLQRIGRYRAAEALLSRGTFQRRGKPGQTSSPVGRELHDHATRLAKLVVRLRECGHLCLGPGAAWSIDSLAVLEAFPNAFLAVMINDTEFPHLNRDASDRFWEIVVPGGTIGRLLSQLLPGYASREDPRSIKDHDQRAAFICSLSALAMAVGKFVAVGCPVDGEILLPPVWAWGAGDGTEPWAQVELRKNVQSLHKDRNRPHFRQARMIRDGRVWNP